MKKKVSFDIESAMKSRLDDYAKGQHMNLSSTLNYIIGCHFDKVDHNEDTLNRIEDKLDALILKDNKPVKSLKNDGEYKKIVNCIQKNVQDIGAVALIELIDIIPELKQL